VLVEHQIQTAADTEGVLHSAGLAFDGGLSAAPLVAQYVLCKVYIGLADGLA
jgi:hypothetical protein